MILLYLKLVSKIVSNHSDDGYAHKSDGRELPREADHEHQRTNESH